MQKAGSAPVRSGIWASASCGSGCTALIGAAAGQAGVHGSGRHPGLLWVQHSLLLEGRTPAQVPPPVSCPWSAANRAQGLDTLRPHPGPAPEIRPRWVQPAARRASVEEAGHARSFAMPNLPEPNRTNRACRGLRPPQPAPPRRARPLPCTVTSSPCPCSACPLLPADYAPPKPQPVRSARQGAAAGRQQGAAAAAPGGLPARAAGAAVNAAGSALQGAGSRLFPLLGQLYSQAAGTLIGERRGMAGPAGRAGVAGLGSR